MKFLGIPIIGTIGGTVKNLVVTTNNTAQVASHVDTIGGSSNQLTTSDNQPSSKTGWVMTKITSISQTVTNEYACLGVGYTNTGEVIQVAWVKKGGNWQIGTSSFTTIRPTGVLLKSNNYYVARGDTIAVSDFVYTRLPPGGGFAGSLPSLTSVGGGDSLVSGSVIVSSSTTDYGTWTGPSWTHNPDGLLVGRMSTAYTTQYTFPGSSLSNPQTQKVFAKYNEDLPPVVWGDNSVASSPDFLEYSGYFGIIGGANITVKWAE